MNKFSIALAGACLMAAPAFAGGHATGDAAAGEEAFSQCQTCHVVVNDEGETLAGRNARTGPNLYNLFGRAAGTVEGFRYSPSIVEAGEAGLVWDEEQFVAYVQDPTGYLREYLDNNRARGKMSYKVREEADAVNLWAYLVSLSPES
ncbi:MAG: cytochrome C [Rhodobacteraceae bacterium]|jgi:cytochrome c|nr:cytochrome C [Alphaproteobacteria bacterium]MBT8473923.1 cytochrome C [Alphaproteobacteria bacterium]NNF71568.1 cytochrome C [Paracoccaceae bacterium]NNK68687.1 cytochrome C [Paracoccaceae bacterium]